MKRRILIIACALALLAGCLVLSSLATADEHTAYCEKCQQTVVWEPIVYGNVQPAAGETTVQKHYYVPADKSNASQIIVKGGATLCVDLNGKNQTVIGRAFTVNGATAESPAMLNIQDSVGNGSITSTSGTKAGGYTTDTNNVAGGVIYIDDYTTLNIYGGTYSLDVKNPDVLRTSAGGVVAIYKSGVMNMYGGTINGAKVSSRGGAVTMEANGAVNLYGGQIKAGTAPTGKCINVNLNSQKVLLSGDAQAEEIYLPSRNTNVLELRGTFTGKANITYAANVSGISEGVTIGTVTENGSISNDAELFCTNGFAVVAEGTALKLAKPSAANRYAECPHCKAVVKWEPFATPAPNTEGTYHFYLTQDYPSGAQYSIKGGAKVCLDLNGHSYITRGRALTTANKGTELSVVDTVGGGIIHAKGGNNNPFGGVASFGDNTTFNLYSGTLQFTHTPANSTGYGGTARGGVIYAGAATISVYGGKIIGGAVVDTTYEVTGIEGAGGAIFISGGTLNLMGGEILSGEASAAGPGIYLATTSTKVNLGGDVKVEDIYFPTYAPESLVVQEGFTGTAGVSFDSSIALYQGLKVGTYDASDWNAIITCASEEYPTIMPQDGHLVVSAFPVGAVAGVNDTGYTSLQEALNAAKEGDQVQLLKGVEGDVTINKNIYLQLNGCSIDGTLTIAEGCTVYGMDSATLDFTVADGMYGKITKVVGNIQGAAAGTAYTEDSYLAVNEDGAISFHCVKLQIYAMTLRVNATDDKQEPGLFYKSYFKADEKAAPLLSAYGVALSLNGEPTAENLEAECCYTSFDGFESGAMGNLGNTSSTLLTGILKQKYSDGLNQKNAQRPIYGRAYALTADGQYLFGSTVSRSLAQQLEAIDQIVPSLAEVQVSALTKMYTKFKTVLSGMELPGIAEAVQTEEEGTLKILVLGNSHGLDATNLLYEVFHNEAPEQKVVIGALYYSGCTMKQHDEYLTNNTRAYRYYKNDGTNPNRTWSVTETTCLEALEDEQWDYIFMQQMNNNSGIETYYTAASFKGSWKVVADYLMNNQDIAPKLGFHMVWTNPDNYELYLNDNAPYKTSGSAAAWRNNHELHWAGEDGKYDQSKLYQDIVRCVQKYLVNDTSLVGRPFDLILPAGTAIEYAQDVCGRSQEHIYRDYTHINDYGRLIAAYTWYASIMGVEELTEVNTNEIPAVLKYNSSKFPAANANGIYEVTEDMKADLIESVNWALKNPFSLPAE